MTGDEDEDDDGDNDDDDDDIIKYSPYIVKTSKTYISEMTPYHPPSPILLGLVPLLVRVGPLISYLSPPTDRQLRFGQSASAYKDTYNYGRSDGLSKYLCSANKQMLVKHPRPAQ